MYMYTGHNLHVDVHVHVYNVHIHVHVYIHECTMCKYAIQYVCELTHPVLVVYSIMPEVHKVDNVQMLQLMHVCRKTFATFILNCVYIHVTEQSCARHSTCTCTCIYMYV